MNVRVGGVYASQHTLGEAADIALPKTCYTDWDDYLAHTDMYIANKNANRHQVFRDMQKY